MIFLEAVVSLVLTCVTNMVTLSLTKTQAFGLVICNNSVRECATQGKLSYYEVTRRSFIFICTQNLVYLLVLFETWKC